MPDTAGPEPLTVTRLRSGLQRFRHDLCSVQTGRRDGLTDSRLSHAYLPSPHPRPPQRTGEARARAEELGADGLMLQELLESTFGGHLSSTSMFGPAQRSLLRIADSLT